MRRLIRSDRIAHLAFLVGVVLKGLDSCLELLGGITLVLVSRAQIQHAITLLVRQLAGNPSGFVARHATEMAQHLNPGTQQFIAAYLLAHGIIKVTLVAGLLKGVRWIFPVALVILTGFIVYQVWRLAHMPSWALAAFTVMDAIVVVLVWLEWRSLTTRPTEYQTTR
jgi:uncharacterized membrane protein